jgi:uncharacterized protein YchJ
VVGIMLDCDPRRLAAARAQVSLLESAPACGRFVAGAAIATAPMALVRGHFSSYLGNADGYNFAAVVARR